MLLAQTQSNQSKVNENFFHPNNPLMWLSGMAVIGLIVGLVLIIRSRRKKLAVK